MQTSNGTSGDTVEFSFTAWQASVSNVLAAKASGTEPTADELAVWSDSIDAIIAEAIETYGTDATAVHRALAERALAAEVRAATV